MQGRRGHRRIRTALGVGVGCHGDVGHVGEAAVAAGVAAAVGRRTEVDWVLDVRLVQHSVLNIARKEMFYLTMHSTHFIYSYMVARGLLHAPSHKTG